MVISWKKYHLSTKFKTNCLALVKKLRALSLMGFFHFSVSFALLTSRVSSLLWEFTNSLICNYGRLHLSSKNHEFFWFTQTNLASRINKPWVFQVHSYCVFRSPEKLKVFWFEKSNLFEWTEKTQDFLMRDANCHNCKSMNW